MYIMYRYTKINKCTFKIYILVYVHNTSENVHLLWVNKSGLGLTSLVNNFVAAGDFNATNFGGLLLLDVTCYKMSPLLNQQSIRYGR